MNDMAVKNIDEPLRIALSGHTCGYLCDVVERFTRLEGIVADMRWRAHRGEPEFLRDGIWRARKEVKALSRDLEMLEFVMKSENSSSE